MRARCADVCGAESIDAARDRWWMGLRDAEAEHYDAGASFDEHERLYRYGFTAAVTRRRTRAGSESLDLWDHLDAHERSVVRRGYERGLQSAARGRQAARDQAA